MADKKTKTTSVRQHPRQVPISKKNPSGITIVDQHLRQISSSSPDKETLWLIFKTYQRKGILFPSKGKLPEYKNADKYDELIAVWTDFFNKRFEAKPPLDPNVVKALIGTESGFEIDPPGNKIAIGIAQITKKTWKVLQDPKGETTEYIFKNIRQKDLKDPTIAIPLAVRWLFRKRALATNKLKRIPTNEEVILEYKGMLQSRTPLKERALKNFRKKYDSLKN